MSGFLERVKGWFGGKRGTGPSAATGGDKRWSLGPAATTGRMADDAALAFAGTGAAAAGVAGAVPARGAEAGLPASDDEELSLDEPAGPPGAARPGRGAPALQLDILDPQWMRSLEDLPARMAESAARTAAGVRRLEHIGAELEGHRQATRVIADSVRQLPDLALSQTQVLRETCKGLQRQTLVLESVLDGITELRAAFRTVEESSRRHLQAIAQLEYGHRQVLFEYQTMLLKSHRRLGRMAALGIALAAVAIAGVGYAIYLVATAGQ
jgi:hypothetical protein